MTQKCRTARTSENQASKGIFVTLRKKATLVIWSTAVVMAAAITLTAYLVLGASFGALEESDARQDVARAYDAILAQTRNLSLKMADWAAWDDTYKFIDDANKAYETANLTGETYQTGKLDLVVIARSDGTIVHGSWLDRAKGQLEELDHETRQIFRPGTVLTSHANVESEVSGILMTPRGPALAASRPITTSDKTGEIKGTIVFVRLLDAHMVDMLSKTSHVDLALQPLPGILDHSSVPMPVSDASLDHSWWTDAGVVSVRALSAADLESSMELADVFGRPALRMTLRMDRAVHREAQRATVLMTCGVGLACLTLTLVTAGSLRWLVLDRLSVLERDVQQISAGTGTEDRITVSGTDELGRLGDEIATMVTALRLAENQAKEAAEARSRFLANTSHEVRTPLNGIVCALELLSRAGLAPAQAKYVRIAQLASEHLMLLINDILDLSKLEAGKFEIESVEFDLPETLGELGALYAPKAEAQRIALTCEVAPRMPRMVKGDVAKIRQVVSNLISNAVKFTDHGGVALRAVVDRDDGKTFQLCVSVSDTGPGIPPERVHRLFNSFSQLDASTTRRHGGTGLGLAICKKLIEMMGGQIAVASEPGRGSTFWFTLPLEKAASEVAASQGATLDLRSARIWVATVGEHSDRLRTVIQELGLNVIDDDDIGMSVCDILVAEVPAADRAAEVIGRLPIRPQNRPAVVAMITDGADAPEVQANLRALGIDAFFPWPLDDAQVADALAVACGAVKPATIEERQTSRSSAETRTRLRVLVAEDNEINRLVMSDLLSGEACDCAIAPNGRRAVELATREAFDLILMDCQMPEMDGYQATRALRDLEQNGCVLTRSGGRIPIIALTANTTPEDRAKCESVGMNGLLCKPIEVAALVSMLDQFRPSVPIAGSESSTSTPRYRATSNQAGDAQAGTDAPTVDLADLGQRCRGKRGLMKSILERFAASLEGQLVEIASSITARDGAKVATQAHSLKGAAASVGCKPLAAAALAVESAGRASDLDAAAKAHEQLTAQAARFTKGLPGIMDELAAAQAA